MKKSFLGKWAVRLFVKRSRILSNQRIGERFQLLKIHMPGRRRWIPGQKVQVIVGPDELRSYTPLSWDERLQCFETLIYNHGKGPGARWAESARPNEVVEVLGPRASLNLSQQAENFIFVGDETTFGLAHALEKNVSHVKGSYIFEVDSAKSCAQLLELYVPVGALVVEKTAFDAHLESIKDQISRSGNKLVILSGRKKAMEALAQGLPEGVQVIRKMYWGWKEEAPN